MKFVNKNYYEILDIDPSASEEDVKRAYRLVRGTWKPDSIAIYSLYTPDESEAIGHKLEEAFQILSSPERRASYDRYLKYATRIPPTLAEPDTFWDIVHGIELPSGEQDLLEDVTDLLAESAVEVEEVAEEVVREAAGGDARGFDRVISDERAGYGSDEALPDREPGNERGKNRAPTFSSSGAAHGTSARHAAGSSPRPPPVSSARPATPSREVRPAVPAAPAAPPVKGGATVWTPPPGSRAEPPRAAPAATRSEPPRDAAPTATRVEPPRAAPPAPRATPSAARSESRESRDARDTRTGSSSPSARAGVGLRPPAGTSEPDARAQAGEGGWSRSYAQSVKPLRPLADRPISAEMFADLEGEHGLGGAYLKSIREYKGVTLNDLCERTKIQCSYLRYLEEERYSDLPPAVYVEGFVSQVARLLKLDVDRVVGGYMARYHRPDPREPDES